MRKRFRFKQKKNILIKILILLIIGYLIFIAIYNIIYKKYINKIENKEFISEIIERINYNTTKIDKYKNPEYILKRTLNIKELNNDLETIKEQKNNEIYIYSTHETEEYKDNHLEHYNILPNVKTMSYILEDLLVQNNINVEVEKESVVKVLRNNKWSYNKSYDASRKLIENKIRSNNYKLIIDLHRDSSSLDKTLIEYNSKKYARILFVVGEEHQNYQSNYKLALNISNKLNELIPNISRGIVKKSGEGVNGIYNQDLNTNMILIELGGQYNQIEELSNTLEILSNVIINYLKEV